ncbi:MAG TPA: RidA family protein [Acidimicrobiales bacterium]|jgi:reactive intermediate/imine deaminase|nr:RidA family protein [Acidimicrobiales bacterium]
MGAEGIARHRFADILAEPVSHYTDAVVAGGFIFIAGMLADDATGALVGAGDVVAQTEQIFENIEAILARLDASIHDVVKLVVYVTDIDDRVAINTVRARRFGETRPTSTLVQVSALVNPDARIEIETVALVPTRVRRTQ